MGWLIELWFMTLWIHLNELRSIHGVHFVTQENHLTHKFLDVAEEQESSPPPTCYHSLQGTVCRNTYMSVPGLCIQMVPVKAY